MNERLAKLGLAVLAMGAIAAPVALLTNAQAQQPGVSQGPTNRLPGEFGQRGQGPGPGMGMGMMGGGGATMIDDNNNLYVMRGNTIFKIDKGTMRINGHVDLPMPEPMQGFGGGQPGGQGFGNRGGQGGQGGGFGGRGGQGGQGGQGGGGGGGQDTPPPTTAK